MAEEPGKLGQFPYRDQLARSAEVTGASTSLLSRDYRLKNSWLISFLFETLIWGLDQLRKILAQPWPILVPSSEHPGATMWSWTFLFSFSSTVLKIKNRFFQLYWDIINILCKFGPSHFQCRWFLFLKSSLLPQFLEKIKTAHSPYYLIYSLRVAREKWNQVVVFVLFCFNIYLFIWLHRVFVATCGIFVVACGIFSCSMWDLVPSLEIKPGPPALGAQSLNRWTTREVPKPSLMSTISPYPATHNLLIISPLGTE